MQGTGFGLPVGQQPDQAPRGIVGAAVAMLESGKARGKIVLEGF